MEPEVEQENEPGVEIEQENEPEVQGEMEKEEMEKQQDFESNSHVRSYV